MFVGGLAAVLCNLGMRRPEGRQVDQTEQSQSDAAEFVDLGDDAEYDPTTEPEFVPRNS